MSPKKVRVDRAAPQGGWPNQKKTPRAVEPATSRKRIPDNVGIEDDEPWHRQPVWRFGYLDSEAPSAASTLSVKDYATFHAALASFELQKCSEIWGNPSNGCKKYDVATAHENITSRLTAIERDDETALHTLRVTGAFRVYGIMRQNVYHVLWIDRDHEMWPAPLKNT